MYDIIIVGGGPAGLTAALYARRSGKSVLVLEREGFGGQIAHSPRVQNFPGTPELSGAEFADRLLGQALSLGVETDVAEAVGLRAEEDVRYVLTDEGTELPCRAVILCAGARHRRLGVAGEEALAGRGVYYCAVCDGGFFAGRDVAVAGGGDSALQEAMLLSERCRSVTVLHRREDFRAEAALQQALFSRPNVKKRTGVTVSALSEAEGELTGLTLRRVDTGEEEALPCAALFVAVGMEPQNAPFAAALPLDAAGYAAVGEDCAAADGVFAAGDCRAKGVRQLTTAVADGAVAALGACRYIDSLS